MAVKNDTTAVRIHNETKDVLDGKEKRINAARKRNKLSPLTKMQVIEIAVNNLTVEMGVQS